MHILGENSLTNEIHASSQFISVLLNCLKSSGKYLQHWYIFNGDQLLSVLLCGVLVSQMRGGVPCP